MTWTEYKTLVKMRLQKLCRDDAAYVLDRYTGQAFTHFIEGIAPAICADYLYAKQCEDTEGVKYTYFVCYHFFSNWSSDSNGNLRWTEIKAHSPEEACRLAFNIYGPEFFKDAVFTVTTQRPANINL